MITYRPQIFRNTCRSRTLACSQMVTTYCIPLSASTGAKHQFRGRILLYGFFHLDLFGCCIPLLESTDAVGQKLWARLLPLALHSVHSFGHPDADVSCASGRNVRRKRECETGSPHLGQQLLGRGQDEEDVVPIPRDCLAQRVPHRPRARGLFDLSPGCINMMRRCHNPLALHPRPFRFGILCSIRPSQLSTSAVVFQYFRSP